MSSLLFIDLETTGFSTENNAVWEIGAIAVIDGEIAGKFATRMKPHADARISPGSLKLSGVTEAEIRSYQNPLSAINEFIQWLDSFETMFKLVGHNTGFDRRFLYSLFCRHGFHSSYIRRIRMGSEICTLAMAGKLDKKKFKFKGKKLGDLCDYFDIKLEGAHRAEADILATYELYKKLSEILPKEENRARVFESYQKKREHYLDASYVQFNSNGDVYINAKATSDPEALKFLAGELWSMYSDEK
jgi:DNA polymerase III epsilon subunit-like protein